MTKLIDSVSNWSWDVILSDYVWSRLLLCYAQTLCSVDYEATKERSSDQITLSFYATKVSKILCLKSFKQVTKMIPLKLFMHVLQQRGIKIYPSFLHARGGNISFADTCWYRDTYFYWCEKYFLEKTYLSSRKRRDSRKGYTDGFTQGNVMPGSEHLLWENNCWREWDYMGFGLLPQAAQSHLSCCRTCLWKTGSIPGAYNQCSFLESFGEKSGKIRELKPPPVKKVFVWFGFFHFVVLSDKGFGLRLVYILEALCSLL